MKEYVYMVKPEDEGRAIKELLKREFGFSGRRMTLFKQNRCVFLNGESMPGWVECGAGDVISVRPPAETSYFEPEDIPISPVYEDDRILVIDKQPGVVVHPTHGYPDHTIANGIMKFMADSGAEPYKIRFVNRLDMDTSGLLIVAKDADAQEALVRQMKSGRTSKKYLAVVDGYPEADAGMVDAPIGRPDPLDVRRGVCEDGYPSVTHYKVIERFREPYSLVELSLGTGRTHQIRVHMSYIGHPVTCDHLYGVEDPALIGRQALHAYHLEFRHPTTKEQMVFEAPMPEDMKALAEKLR